MACAPSTVPMLGCCGDACAGYRIEGYKYTFRSPMGTKVGFNVATESGEVPTLGPWFVNWQTSGWNGTQVLPYRLGQSHSGTTVTYQILTVTSRTENSQAGTARYSVNGVNVGNGTFRHDMIQRESALDVWDQALGWFDLAPASRSGAGPLYYYDATPTGVAQRSGVGESIFGAESVVTIAGGIGSVVGGIQLHVIDAFMGFFRVPHSGPYRLQHNLSHGSPSNICTVGQANGSYDVRMTRDLLDRFNLETQRPYIGSFGDPRGCSPVNPFPWLCSLLP